MTEQHSFKWRHFQSDIILLGVRWYVRYPLSYKTSRSLQLIADR
jgi:IS6 family transposase